MDSSKLNYLTDYIISNVSEEDKDHVQEIAEVIGALAQYLADFGS